VALKENGRRFVRARAVDAEGKTSEWSPMEEYTLNAKPEAPAAPGGLLPKDGLTVVPGAVSFRWSEARDPDPSESERLSYELVLEGPEGERRLPVQGGSHTLDLPVGTWRWSVVARDPGGLLTRSAVQRLVVKLPPPPPAPKKR
jgi:hypothetical protein